MSTPPNDAWTAAILAWWRELYADYGQGLRGDSGGRARLRRADTILEALCEEAFHDLVTAMEEEARKAGRIVPDAQSYLWPRVALAAAVLAERRGAESGPLTFAAALGRATEGEVRHMSELRFNALMKAMTHGDADGKLKALRRAVALLGDQPFQAARFVRDLLYFDDRTRIDWVFAYFQTPRHGDADNGANAQDQKEIAL
jgi:CRISPR type I-E-associated protein CasB/Cse2